MKTDGKKSIAQLLNINISDVNKLVDLFTLYISSAVGDAKAKGEKVCVIDFGYGYISVDLTSMTCKFTPAQKLKDAIQSALASPIDPLELKLEESLSAKLEQAVDEVI